MSEIVKSKVICPKCKSKDLFLCELWKDHKVDWLQKDGKFDRSDGNLTSGDPYKVQAECNKCKHVWTIKGAIQINDVIKPDNNATETV